MRTPRNSRDGRSVDQIGWDVESDIRETIQSIYGTPQRQASDAIVLVVLGLFIGTIAMLADLFIHF